MPYSVSRSVVLMVIGPTATISVVASHVTR
jgi:hypothetical protein